MVTTETIRTLGAEVAANALRAALGVADAAGDAMALVAARRQRRREAAILDGLTERHLWDVGILPADAVATGLGVPVDLRRLRSIHE